MAFAWFVLLYRYPCLTETEFAEVHDKLAVRRVQQGTRRFEARFFVNSAFAWNSGDATVGKNKDASQWGWEKAVFADETFRWVTFSVDSPPWGPLQDLPAKGRARLKDNFVLEIQ